MQRRREGGAVLWKTQTAAVDACWIVFLCFLMYVLRKELGLKY